MITTQSNLESQRDRDHQLIAQYMTGELTLLGIADMNSMTLKELIEWSRQPHIEKLLSDIAEASTLRAQRLAADAAPHAIAKLTQLLSAKGEEAVRRAASAILRASKPLPEGRPGVGSPSQPSLPESPPKAQPETHHEPPPPGSRPTLASIIAPCDPVPLCAHTRVHTLPAAQTQSSSRRLHSRPP